MVSIEDQIACVEREIKMREAVYPRWVNAKPPKMTAKTAEHQLAAMRAVLDTLKAVHDEKSYRASFQSLPKFRGGRGRRHGVVPITERQKAVLDFIKAFIGEHGYPPTSVEISNHYGFRSVNAGKQYVDALVRRGYLAITPNIARGLKVIE